jgi:putative protease
VLARETSLEEIAKMKKLLPLDMELEAFVHGAMCMAYSGRCFISSMLTGRSGNQGECTQPCRWGYHLTEQKRPGEFFPVEEHENGTNILSSRDLCCLSLIDDLKRAGVASFKIEGRMKTPYYVATVVRAYRNKIDGTMPDDILMEELEAVSHRPYSTGFYEGDMFRYKPDDHLPYVTTCSFAGTVLKVEEGRVLIQQRSKFSLGDKLEVVSPKVFGYAFRVESITDEEGNDYDLEVLHEFDHKGNHYLAVIPADPSEESGDDDSLEVTLLKSVTEDGEPILLSIDDDDELDEVYAVLMDELYGDEEEEDEE